MRAAPAATASVARIRLFFIIDRYFFRRQTSLVRSVPLFLIGTNGTRRRRFKITSGASYTETVRLGLRLTLPSPPHSPALSTASRAIIISTGAATSNPMPSHRPHTSSPRPLSCVTFPPATSPPLSVCCRLRWHTWVYLRYPPPPPPPLDAPPPMDPPPPPPNEPLPREGAE